MLDFMYPLAMGANKIAKALLRRGGHILLEM